MGMQRLLSDHSHLLLFHVSGPIASWQLSKGKVLMQVNPGWKQELVLALGTGDSTFSLNAASLCSAAVSQHMVEASPASQSSSQ